jgi:hypothetical protein
MALSDRLRTLLRHGDNLREGEKVIEDTHRIMSESLWTLHRLRYGLRVGAAIIAASFFVSRMFSC